MARNCAPANPSPRPSARPLPVSESIMIAWPQTVGVIASTIVLFVLGYILFQRQEARA